VMAKKGYEKQRIYKISKETKSSLDPEQSNQVYLNALRVMYSSTNWDEGT